MLSLGGAWLITAANTTAGPTEPDSKTSAPPVAPAQNTYPDAFKADASYVFSSPIRFAEKRIGKGNEVHGEVRYSRRIPITGNWYFHFGIDYEQFDFGGSKSGAPGPLPGCLQDLNAPIGIAYLVNNQIGFLAQVRPGVYFEHRIDSGAFDIPVEIGGVIPIKNGKLYLTYGIGTSNLRHYPVIPNLGVVWLINDKWRLMGVAPEPRLIYTYNDRLSLWLGGEVLIQSFKTDRNDFAPVGQGKTTSGSVVDYTEARAGLGFSYTPWKDWDLNVAGGYALEREFDFWRAKKCYTADPAPFVRAQLKVAF